MDGMEKRREAVPIKSIRDRQTGKRVGWLYRWNDGSTGSMWMEKPVGSVVYDELPGEGRDP